jgi:hypothetical protein
MTTTGSLQGYHHAVNALISLGDLTGVDLAAGATSIGRYSSDHWVVYIHDLSAADFDLVAEYLDAECNTFDGGAYIGGDARWADMKWTLLTKDVAPCVACGELTTHVDDERGRLCTPHLAAAARAHDEHVEATP